MALKLPRLQIFESPELTRRFVLEAQAAARLDHPNVVSIYDVGELGPDPGHGLYIASAYCSEGSLAAWIARQSVPIAARQAADLLIKLADGVQHLHDHGILHRDLKPSNVLLQRSGSAQPGLAAAGAGNEDLAGLVPRIGDFGLARLREGSAEQTLSGHPIGSPSYMSPEQAEGRLSALGPATDVYGLGRHPLLPADRPAPVPGREPVGDGPPGDPGRTRAAPPPPAGRAARPRDHLHDLHAQGPGPSLRSRPPRLRDDLTRWLEGKPIHARPVSSLERLLKWARRRPAIAAPSAILILSLSRWTDHILSQWLRAEEALGASRRDQESLRQTGLRNVDQSSGETREIWRRSSVPVALLFVPLFLRRIKRIFGDSSGIT